MVSRKLLDLLEGLLPDQLNQAAIDLPQGLLVDQIEPGGVHDPEEEEELLVLGKTVDGRGRIAVPLASISLQLGRHLLVEPDDLDVGRQLRGVFSSALEGIGLNIYAVQPLLMLAYGVMGDGGK